MRVAGTMLGAALGVMLLVSDGGAAGRTPEPGYVEAPVPDRSFDVPRARGQREVELAPALTDTGARAGLGSGHSTGSDYDRELARRSQPMTAIGNRLAPGLTLSIPLK
jgi:hypothetical protein